MKGGGSPQGWHQAITLCPTWTIRNDSGCLNIHIRSLVLIAYKLGVEEYTSTHTAGKWDQSVSLPTTHSHSQTPKAGAQPRLGPMSVSDLSFFIHTMKGLTSQKFQRVSSYWYSDCQLPRETECPHLRTPWEAVSSYENPIHFLRKKVLILWPNRLAWLYHEWSKSNTKCCSLKMGSRAPRSKAIPFFLGSSRPLLGSW